MREREFFIDNLLVRIHFIIKMIRWTGLAPWEFEFPFPGSLTSTVCDLSHSLPPAAVCAHYLCSCNVGMKNEKRWVPLKTNLGSVIVGGVVSLKNFIEDRRGYLRPIARAMPGARAEQRTGCEKAGKGAT